MDRAEAIGALNFYRSRFYNEPLGTKERDLAEAINVVLPEYCALREQESAENAHCNEWISVKERLPKESGPVLAYETSLGVVAAYYHADMISSAWQSITHWRPLPEPPAVQPSEERPSGNVNGEEGADHE